MNAKEEIEYLRQSIKSEKEMIADMDDRIVACAGIRSDSTERLKKYEERLAAELSQVRA